MGDVLLPRILKGYLDTLNPRQRATVDKIMPVSGTKRIYLHLVDTPTPPIIMGLAQPPKISTLSVAKINEQKILGIRLKVDDLQVAATGLTFGNILRLFWRLKSQTFTLIGMSKPFLPLLLLPPKELKEMGNKLNTHMKPLIDLMPRTNNRRK